MMNDPVKPHRDNVIFIDRCRQVPPSDLRHQAQELIATGQMPRFAQVLEAVAEARRKYADKIIAARKESERLSK
jgi:hypothetical protein